MFNFDRPDLVCGKMKKRKRRSILPVVVIIAVTVEPLGAGTIVLTNRNVENTLAEMGYIDEGEILTLLQNHGKKINHVIREKLANGLPRVIEKMNSEEDL